MNFKLHGFCVVLVLVLIAGFSTCLPVSADTNTPVLVLTYHHLLEQKSNVNNSSIVTVENFEQQMKYLKEKGYHTITLDELNQYLKKETALPPKSVLITFDDGYQSNYIYAYPILKKYGFTSSIFVITSKISEASKVFDPKILSYMSVEEINNSKDVFEFACHTHDLHQLDKDKKSLFVASGKDIIIKDLRKSKAIIHTKYFAYPYGQYDNQSLELLSQEGFELAFTTSLGFIHNPPNKLQLKRFIIYNSTAMDTFKKIIGDTDIKKISEQMSVR